MTYTTRPAPTVPVPAIIGVAVMASVTAGRFLAHGNIAFALAVVMATAFLAVVSFDLSSAIGCWVVLLFLVNLAALGKGPSLVGILLVLAWLGARALRPVHLPVV